MFVGLSSSSIFSASMASESSFSHVRIHSCSSVSMRFMNNSSGNIVMFSLSVSSSGVKSGLLERRPTALFLFLQYGPVSHQTPIDKVTIAPVVNSIFGLLGSTSDSCGRRRRSLCVVIPEYSVSILLGLG